MNVLASVSTNLFCVVSAVSQTAYTHTHTQRNILGSAICQTYPQPVGCFIRSSQWPKQSSPGPVFQMWALPRLSKNYILKHVNGRKTPPYTSSTTPTSVWYYYAITFAGNIHFFHLRRGVFPRRIKNDFHRSLIEKWQRFIPSFATIICNKITISNRCWK